MAFFQMNYHSDALKMGVSVNVVLPENAKSLIGMGGSGVKEYKTLYLLHGLSDDETIWERRTSIERYAAERGIAVVMPSVGRSWYTDTAYGAKYFTFVTEELPRVCRNYFRGMSDKREDNYIAGLSMGGYGAVKAALTFPEKYAGAASLSGAFNIADVERNVTDEMRGIFGFDLKSMTELENTPHNVHELARRLAAAGKEAPKLFIWCGTEDGLLKSNRDFVNTLDNLHIAKRYEESEGNHSWRWWDLHVTDAIDYLMKE